MNHSPAYILAQHLIDREKVTAPSESSAWPVYVGTLPDSDDIADDAVAALDTAPLKDGRVMSSGEVIVHQGVQLLIRSEEHNAGFLQASDLATALAEVDDVDVEVESGSTYTVANVTQATGILDLGQEPGTKRRWVFSVNFLVTIGAG